MSSNRAADPLSRLKSDFGAKMYGMMRVLRWVRKWFFSPNEVRRAEERRYYDKHPEGPGWHP